MKCTILGTIAFCSGFSSVAALTSTNPKQPVHYTSSRRESLKVWTSAALMLGSLMTSEDAIAFPNKISDKYDSRPKQRGALPKGLGVGTRKDMAGEEYLGLKPCGAGESVI